MRGMCEQAANISVGMRICDSCRKTLARTPACLPEVESQHQSYLNHAESSSQSGSPRSQCPPTLKNFSYKKEATKQEVPWQEIGRGDGNDEKSDIRRYWFSQNHWWEWNAGQLKENFHATKESLVKFNSNCITQELQEGLRGSLVYPIISVGKWSLLLKKRESFHYLIQSLGTHFHKKLPTWLLPFMKMMSPVGWCLEK